MNVRNQPAVIIPFILKKIGSQVLADRMNDLLSDFNVFNQNVKGFHWNFIGPDFFDLHEKFEDLSGKLSQDISKLANSIRMTGYEPLHSYSDYLKNSIHKEITGINSDEESILCVIEGLTSLILSCRMSAIEAEEADEIFTEKMLRQFAFELENELWVFTMFAKY